MSDMLKVFMILLLIFTIAVSCSEEPQQVESPQLIKKKIINPNGDSELALLMRAMFDEAELIKQQVAEGRRVKTKLNYEEILTAHATEPEKAASPKYKAFAEAYLQTMESLKTAGPDQVISIYDEMVAQCMSCHQAMCPGPMVKIKKLM